MCALLPFALAESLNVTMASLRFLGNTSEQSASAIEKASLDRVAELVDEVAREGSNLVALPEGFFWWYLPTREKALEHAPPFLAVVDGVVKDSGVQINPCTFSGDTSSALLASLSCMAKDKSVYIASNMATKSCNVEDGCKLWNTEVVFDYEGYIVATYRKSHVYGSTPPFDAPDPLQQDIAWFSIGGLKVGLLVCFDLEFAEPANKLVSSASVDAVLMSMSWVNTPPLSWSILYQQAWSLRNKGITLVVVNDGSSAQTWGNGAYHNGRVVSSQEAFTASEGEEDYPAITWVGLPVQDETDKVEKREEFYDELRERGKRAFSHEEIDDSAAPFPCIIPSYGQGMCANLMAHGNNGSGIGSGAVKVHHQDTHCHVRIASPRDPPDGGKVLAAALDVELRDPGAGAPLHLLICSVFVCSVPPSATRNTQIEACDAVYGSFSSPQVDLTLVTHKNTPNSYEVLPLASGADLHTLSPHQLKFTDRQTEESGGWSASLSVEAHDASLGVAGLIAVDQGTANITR
jgi:predicted amidohydrolase